MALLLHFMRPGKETIKISNGSSSVTWGMLCPYDTPEGESCGLVKNLALMTHVTTDDEEPPLISLCYCLGVENLELLSPEELHSSNSFLVIFNGLILSKHRRPQKFAIALRRLRRAGKIGEFVIVFVNEKQHDLLVEFEVKADANIDDDIRSASL